MRNNVQLIQKGEKAVYSQSLPMLIHLKEDLFFKMGLMLEYELVTVLPFST